MSSNNHLSDTQKAILTAMGVTPWQLRSMPQATDRTSVPVSDPAPAESKVQQGVNVNVAAHEHPMVTDVLYYLGMQEQTLHFGAEGLYSFEWQIGDEIRIERDRLITPALAALTTPEAKKALWQALQQANV